MLNFLNNHETMNTLIQIGAMTVMVISLVGFYLALTQPVHLRRKR